jgi:putative endonuclease
MYYTYVLQSEQDDKFYVGFTKDLKLRPAQLNNATH